ncbi:hypothetical protein DID75_04980 [Candidatus Marinamargulisbacteria bacterium SCGC AG-410-N11]|nr:hypothetical protein DID75_04980 [Candidatus Marinamargulisbacteria bacterium SCGC AG-410-N11]
MQLIPCKDQYLYLEPSNIIDYNHPTIIKKVKALTESCQTELEKAQKIFEFVRDEISHSFDIQNVLITCKASDVLAKGHGICFAKSHLLAAMARTMGIPAGFCYQKLIFDEQKSKVSTTLHGLNAIYLKDFKKWIRLDPRGNKRGVQAEFCIEKEILAFPVRQELGEQDYPKIYSEPDSSVIQCLLTTKCWNWETIDTELPNQLLG